MRAMQFPVAMEMRSYVGSIPYTQYHMFKLCKIQIFEYPKHSGHGLVGLEATVTFPVVSGLGHPQISQKSAPGCATFARRTGPISFFQFCEIRLPVFPGIPGPSKNPHGKTSGVFPLPWSSEHPHVCCCRSRHRSHTQELLMIVFHPYSSCPPPLQTTLPSFALEMNLSHAFRFGVQFKDLC